MTPRRTRLRCMLALLGGLLLSAAATADERRYYFDTAGSELGLAQHTVNAFFQDHDGFIWIATQGGLDQYDGYHYRLFQHDADDPDSLPDSFINAIAEDDQHQIWVGGNTHNVARLDPNSGKAQTFPLPPNTPDLQNRNSISALQFDAKRGLWIGTSAGIELLDTNTGKRRELFRFDAQQPGAAVLDFASGTDGALLAATTAGLWRIARNSDIAEPIATEGIGALSAILVASDGVLYAASSDGLFRIDGRKDHVQRVWPDDASLATTPNHNVLALAQDHQGRLWLAVHGEGLAIVDPANAHVEWLRHNRDIPGSLPEKFVLSLFVDRSGLLWVGGMAHGFATTDPNGAMFRYIADFSPDPATDNNIQAIWEDASHRLWLGTESAGLKRYDPATGTFDSFTDALQQIPPLRGHAREDRSPPCKALATASCG